MESSANTFPVGLLGDVGVEVSVVDVVCGKLFASLCGKSEDVSVGVSVEVSVKELVGVSDEVVEVAVSADGSSKG